MPTYLVSRYSSIPSSPPSRPKPECLTPPNGRGRVGHDALVDPHHAELQALADLQHPGQVPGEGVGGEAVLGVVGPRDRLLVGGERADRRDRAEDLLAHQPRGRRDVGQHGRLEEVARALHRLPAGQHGGAQLDGVGDQLGHLVPRLGVDQRADRDVVVGAAPDRQLPHPLGQPLGELTGDRLVHQEPVRRRARLAHVAHLGQHRPVDGLVDVGVREHQERCVAAQLHRHPQQLLGRLLHQRLAHRRRPGERQLAQPLIADQRLHHRTPSARSSPHSAPPPAPHTRPAPAPATTSSTASARPA